MVESFVNKAQEVVKWFKDNGDTYTSLWDFDDLLKDAKSVISRDIVGQGRWTTSYESVYKFSDNSYVEFSWDEGSTESQEGSDPNLEVYEVEPYEETLIKYRSV